MSNPIELYNEAIGNNEQQETEKQSAKKQVELNQKNIEAWHLWNQLPQTHLFRSILVGIRNKISVGCAQNVANVPQVNDAWIRARQVEIALLDDILMRTMSTGELKTELFSPQPQQQS